MATLFIDIGAVWGDTAEQQFGFKHGEDSVVVAHTDNDMLGHVLRAKQSGKFSMIIIVGAGSPTQAMTPEESQLLENIIECDGYEVHESHWPLAEKLERRGKITISPPRGPDSKWKRATPVQFTEEYNRKHGFHPHTTAMHDPTYG